MLTTFIAPLIFATLAFFLFRSGGGTAGQTLLYVALGAGMMGVWSTTLFGCGGAIAWQRWEGTLELLVSAPTRYDYILVGQTFGAVVFGLLRDRGHAGCGAPSCSACPSRRRSRCVLPLSLLAAIISLGALGHAHRHLVRAVPPRQRARQPARVPDLAGRRPPGPAGDAAVLGAADQLAAGADLGHGGDPGRDHRRIAHRCLPS